VFTQPAMIGASWGGGEKDKISAIHGPGRAGNKVVEPVLIYRGLSTDRSEPINWVVN
jgi:hypothetical protein